MAVEAESPHQYSIILLYFVIVRQMAAEGQSVMEVHMKQRCVSEFLHVEKMAPTDISDACRTFKETKQWM